MRRLPLELIERLRALRPTTETPKDHVGFVATAAGVYFLIASVIEVWRFLTTEIIGPVWRVLRPWLFAVVLTTWLVSGVSAGPYYNSAETGCGSDSNVLMCDDFEHNPAGGTPGTWYSLDCDTMAGGAFTTSEKGWCGTIFANPIDPAGAILCGGGVTPFGNCAAHGGDHGGTGGVNMAMHHFKTSGCGTTGAEVCGVTEVYVRYYTKWAASYSFGAEKHMNLTKTAGDITWFNVQLNCGAGSASSTGYPAIQILHGSDSVCTGGVCVSGCWDQNQGSNIAFEANKWYFVELRLKISSVANAADGVIQMWINDCGSAGTSCGASPILRFSKTNVRMCGDLNNSSLHASCDGPSSNYTDHLIEVIHLENWANPGSTGIGPMWDQIKVSSVGPIGFSGAAAASRGFILRTLVPLLAALGVAAWYVVKVRLVS